MSNAEHNEWLLEQKEFLEKALKRVLPMWKRDKKKREEEEEVKAVTAPEVEEEEEEAEEEKEVSELDFDHDLKWSEHMEDDEDYLPFI